MESIIITLAIDIEMYGARFKEHGVMAIGVSVLNENFELLDSFLCSIHKPSEATYEQRCWDEFWTKDGSPVLKKLEIKSSLSRNEREKNMIFDLIEFRKKWEGICEKNRWELHIVTDNPTFDTGIGISNLMEKHLSEDLKTFIYRPSDGKYNTIWDTNSMIRGYLLGVDPEFTKGAKWGFSKRLRELVGDNAPSITVEHDHLPNNDAYNIAYDYNLLLGLMNGKIKLKKED
jgi:hypothetical protein